VRLGRRPKLDADREQLGGWRWARRAQAAMTDTQNDPTPLTEPQQIPNDDDLGETAPDLPDELEDDDEDIREPGI
jgi:hypothetical protein